MLFAVVSLVLVLLFRHTHALDIHLRYMASRGARHRRFSLLPFVISAVLWVVYGTVSCGGRRGQTLGMMAVGVRAVRDQTLGALGYGRALGRALIEGVLQLLFFLSLLLGVLWALDMLFPLWDAQRQTLHDKVSGAVVVRLPAEH